MRKRILFSALLCLAAVLAATAGLAAEGPSGKISVWIWKGAMDGVEKALPDFKKAYPKIEVEFLVDSKVRQKLLLGLSAAGAGLVDAGGRPLAAGDRVEPAVAASIARCADQFDRRRLFDFPGHLAAISRIEGTPWHVVQLVPASPLYAGKAELLRDTLLTVGLSLAVALLLAMAFISHITKPLQALVARMATVRQGELAGNLPVTGRDELSQLAAGFNEMLGDVRNLLDRVREEQEQKRLAELKTLQLQINPHFLYHAVDSIRWLAVINQDENIERMTSNLSRLLQLSLESPQELVTVAKEIEYVRCFVEIERIRRVRPFSFEVELAPGVEDCLTLRLIVQPLVENALFHGMERCSGPGCIHVRGFVEGTDLLLEVADNGTGMDEATLDKLCAGSIAQTTRGIGVRNVRERLRLCYGEGYDLIFSSEYGSGTVVRVRQPLQGAPQASISDGGLGGSDDPPGRHASGGGVATV